MENRKYSVESQGEWNEDTIDPRQPSWASPDFVFPDDSEDRSYSRRRSIECSAVEIQIVDTEINQDHTVYLIKASCGLKKWYIKRRYKDVHFLDQGKDVLLLTCVLHIFDYLCQLHPLMWQELQII
jgi:hypothetical protein